MENQKPTSTASSAIKADNEGATLREIIGLCLAKWYWFVVSVVVCVVAAYFYSLSCQPVYTRTATVLIKETNARRVSSNDIETMLAASSQMSSKIANEVVSFQAPSLMSIAVKRLGLEVEYDIIGRWHQSVVYGQSIPVVATFIDVPDSKGMSFTIAPIDEGTFDLYDINTSVDGKPVRIKQHVICAYGEAVETPVGKVVVTPNPYRSSKLEWEKPLKIVKRTNEGATNMFLGKFSATPEDLKNRSDVLSLSLSDYNTQRAEDLLNTLITVYNENWVEDMNKTAISTSMFIKDRLSSIEQELSGVDENISQYKSTNHIPDVNAVSTMYMTQNNELTRQLRQLENQLSVTKYLRNYLANNIKTDDLIPTPSGLGDNAISNQVTEFNKEVLRRNNILSNSSEANPLVRDMNNSLQMQRSAIMASVDNQINTLEEQLRIISRQERDNAGLIAESPNQAKALLSLERNQKVKEQLYLYLLQKREENELSQAFTAYNTRLINPPYGSNTPVSPNTSRIFLVALLLGLCIPAAVLYLIQATNTKVRGRKDLNFLMVPFLAEIPQAHKAGERIALLNRIKTKSSEREEETVDIMVQSGSRDVINEAFRVLRTNLEFMGKQSDSHVLLVTSYNPSSGKTFVSLNSAMALAIKGLKVLVIDGDFRRYSVSRTFKLHQKGFADYLASNDTDITRYVTTLKDYNNLNVLPVGSVPPNPSELLSSQKFVDAINELRKSYDYIFIDSAPVDIVADTQIISPVADRTLFVIRAGLLERSMLADFDQLYQDNKYNNLTIVLNGTETSAIYGYRYGARYAYNYGRYGHGRYGHYGRYAYGDDVKPVSQK